MKKYENTEENKVTGVKDTEVKNKTDFFTAWPKIIGLLGSVFMMIPLLVMLIKDRPQEYEHLISNRGLLLLCVIFIIFCSLIFKICKSKDLTSAGMRKLLIIGYLIVFLIQIYVVRNTYFLTGWDPGLARFRAEYIVGGGDMVGVGATSGYSVYPNNLMIFYTLYLIMKVAVLFHFSDPYILCVYASCFCVTFSCLLGSLLCNQFLKSRIAVALYTFLSFFLLVCSPWVSIPYTDTFGMFFVMLAVYLFLRIPNFYIRSGLLILTAFTGYMMKPTCIFTLFAVMLIYLPKVFQKIRVRKSLFLLGMLVIGYSITLGMPLWIQHTLSFQLDPEARMSYAHFLLIGSNADSYGGWNDGDYWLGTNTEGYEARKTVELDTAIERYKNYSYSELKKHLQNKMLFIMNDGAFAWTKEGNFFETEIEHDSFLYPIAKEIFTPDGKYYLAYKTIMQFLWMVVLLGIPFSAFSKRVEPQTTAILFTAICGLITFLMIFEARARYIFLYAPVFIILSVIGYYTLFTKLVNMNFHMKKKNYT